MNFQELSDQELVDAIQGSIRDAIRLTNESVQRLCQMAETDTQFAAAIGPVARALGHLWQAHGEATDAVNAIPIVTPNFGGK